jgi:hypothetical protein
MLQHPDRFRIYNLAGSFKSGRSADCTIGTSEQVEGEEHTLASAEEQIVERRTDRVIDACDLTIEDGILGSHLSPIHSARSLKLRNVFPFREMRSHCQFSM